VISSSNSSKLAAALEEKGFAVRVHLVFVAGWQIEQGYVDQMAALVQTAVQDTNPTTVVFQLLDNCARFTVELPRENYALVYRTAIYAE
jgi:hypothetical protein